MNNAAKSDRNLHEYGEALEAANNGKGVEVTLSQLQRILTKHVAPEYASLSTVIEDKPEYHETIFLHGEMQPTEATNELEYQAIGGGFVVKTGDKLFLMPIYGRDYNKIDITTDLNPWLMPEDEFSKYFESIPNRQPWEMPKEEFHKAVDSGFSWLHIKKDGVDIREDIKILGPYQANTKWAVETAIFNKIEVPEQVMSEHKKLTQDREILKQIKQVFPKFRDPLTKELVLNIVPPNGKDYYEQIRIRRIADDIVMPNNSYSLSHIQGHPSDIAVSGKAEDILHEFDFAINNNRIEPFYMQDLQKYKDANRDSSHKFAATPEDIKKDLSEFLTNMVERTKNLNKGMER